MIDQLTTCCYKLLGALFHVREYLGKSGFIIAYNLFVKPTVYV